MELGLRMMQTQGHLSISRKTAVLMFRKVHGCTSLPVTLEVFQMLKLTLENLLKMCHLCYRFVRELEHHNGMMRSEPSVQKGRRARCCPQCQLYISNQAAPSQGGHDAHNHLTRSSGSCAFQHQETNMRPRNTLLTFAPLPCSFPKYR